MQVTDQESLGVYFGRQFYWCHEAQTPEEATSFWRVIVRFPLPESAEDKEPVIHLTSRSKYEQHYQLLL